MPFFELGMRFRHWLAFSKFSHLYGELKIKFFSSKIHYYRYKNAFFDFRVSGSPNSQKYLQVITWPEKIQNFLPSQVLYSKSNILVIKMTFLTFCTQILKNYTVKPTFLTFSSFYIPKIHFYRYKTHFLT